MSLALSQSVHRAPSSLFTPPQSHTNSQHAYTHTCTHSFSLIPPACVISQADVWSLAPCKWIPVRPGHQTWPHKNPRGSRFQTSSYGPRGKQREDFIIVFLSYFYFISLFQKSKIPRCNFVVTFWMMLLKVRCSLSWVDASFLKSLWASRIGMMIL